MAIVAFDDFDWATLLNPPMTVVDQHIELIGRTAGSQLLTLLGEIPSDGETLGKAIIAPTLKVRESCGAGLAPEERPGANDALKRRSTARSGR
jgi:hypothetical protein